MSIFYLDASAWVKYYAVGSGSSRQTIPRCAMSPDEPARRPTCVALFSGAAISPEE